MHEVGVLPAARDVVCKTGEVVLALDDAYSLNLMPIESCKHNLDRQLCMI